MPAFVGDNIRFRQRHELAPIFRAPFDDLYFAPRTSIGPFGFGEQENRLVDP